MALDLQTLKSLLAENDLRLNISENGIDGYIFDIEKCLELFTQTNGILVQHNNLRHRE